MLMNLKTLQWDDKLCQFFDIPKEILPEIRSSAENYGPIRSGRLKGVPITSVLKLFQLKLALIHFQIK